MTPNRNNLLKACALLLSTGFALTACQKLPASDGAQKSEPQVQKPASDLQSAASNAQTPQRPQSYLNANPGDGFLTPERINSSPALSGPSLQAARIAPSGEFVTVLQGREDNTSQLDLWAYDLETGQGRRLVSSTDLLGVPEVLSDEEKNRRERAREYGSGIISYSWAGDNLLLFPLGGDIYLYNLETKSARQITATNDFETDAKVSQDGLKVAYVRANELYLKDLETGLERQLTQGASQTVRNATASFVVQEEFGRDTGYWMNPDATQIAYTQIDEAPIAIENRLEFGANGVENIAQRYPFAGTDNADVKLGIVSARGGDTRWVTLGESQDIYITRAVWSPNNRHLFVGVLSRDQKTHRFYKIDSLTAKASVFYEETSPTWLNISDTLLAQQDGSLIWAAQRNDVQQLFKINSGGDIRALTPDTLMVHDLLCLSEGTAYVSGWQDSPLSTHVFEVNIEAPSSDIEPSIASETPAESINMDESINIDRSVNPDSAESSSPPRVTPLTQIQGQHSASFNADCSRYLGYHNSISKPPSLRAFSSDGSPLAWLSENKLDSEHPAAPFINNSAMPEFGQIAADDGTKLDYILFKPKDMKAGEKRASVTIVYNGPGVQRVSNRWGRNAFARMLTHHGFVVFMVDGRGASNRGKAFEDLLYRSMGKAEVIDQSAGAAWLAAQSFIDPQRMGVYGWSYGGYMSLHMLSQTDFYASGVAGAPVTDWALYDTAYTERYLGSPDPLSENYTQGAYENASVFSHLDGLTEPFLLIHGMADDNVVFRHSIKLMNEMQSRGAQNMRVMTYPGEKHGFRNPKNRAHKDRQILEFFQGTLDVK